MRHSTRNFRPALQRLEDRTMLSGAPVQEDFGYVQTNLVSNVNHNNTDLPLYDPNLVDPWDVNTPQDNHNNDPVVVADQGSGKATSYQISADGSTIMLPLPPAVPIPTVGSSESSGPTGVANGGGFEIPLPDGTLVSATYIFDTLQGTIVSEYATGKMTSTEIVVDNSQTGNPSSPAVYTGLAAGTYDGITADGPDYLYAANEGTNPGIQVFDSSFNKVCLFAQPQTGQFGNFTDPDLPAGFIPYGVRDIALGSGPHLLYVTYWSPNFRGGAVAVFNNDGTFIGQLGCDTTSTGNLQSPSGLAYVQAGFGQFSNDLLVGNFSSGQIDAYSFSASPATGEPSPFQFVGKILNTSGTPLTIPGLRTIHFGQGLTDPNTGAHLGLLFTADGPVSLYGEITPGPMTSGATLSVYGDQDPSNLNDVITVDNNDADGGVSVTVNGESFSFPNGAISAIDIYPETGANTVSVLNTNVPVTIYDSSSDSVQIGNGDDGLQGIKADVDLANSDPLVDLTIADAHDPIGHRGVFLSSNGLIGMSPLPIQWGDDSISALIIHGGSGGNTYSIINTPNDAYVTFSGGSGNDTFNVLGTGKRGGVVLNTGRGNDVVNIGDSSYSASDIMEGLQVNGQGGTDTLNVDDHANTNSQEYVLTDGSISNGTLGLYYTGMGFVALKGSSAGSGYSIYSTAANVSYSIHGGSGADAFNVSNLYETLSTIKGDLTINGGGGADSLAVDSSQDGTSAYDVFAGLIDSSLASASIFYSSMASVFLDGSSFQGSSYFIYSTTADTSFTINAGAGADAFDVSPPILQVFGANLDDIAGPVRINGGGGADSLSVTDQNNTANDTYAISTGDIKRTGAAKITYAGVPTVTLDGGSGNETFQIKSFDPTVKFAITGGGGVNTLDYAAFSGDVTVDLRLRLATGLTGGISNIQNVTGSKGNDILVGDANPNVLIGGAGRDLIIGGRGADTLIGGSNGDILIGDYTDYDTNITALNAIMTEWDFSDSYTTRYDFITSGFGGLNGPYVLNTTTVHNDLANDTMTGGAGLDWFFASSGDTLTDPVTSGPKKEFITTI